MPQINNYQENLCRSGNEGQKSSQDLSFKKTSLPRILHRALECIITLWQISLEPISHYCQLLLQAVSNNSKLLLKHISNHCHTLLQSVSNHGNHSFTL